MATPSTRIGLRDYCLRRLGSDVLRINVSDEEVEDRIDDALQYWNEFHSDGTVEIFMKHQLTQLDIDNEYVPIADEVCYVENIIPVNTRRGLSNIFDIEYQLHLNDLFDLSFSGGLTSYVQVRQYVEMLDDVFHGRHHFQYARHGQKLFLSIDWQSDVNVDDFILVKATRFVDPEQASKAYNDRWLKAYSTALIQKQWGLNLIKFDGVEMLGGVSINGSGILAEAKEEIEKLEEQIRTMYEAPPDFIIA